MAASQPGYVRDNFRTRSRSSRRLQQAFDDVSSAGQQRCTGWPHP
jgi:hypothetical protein